MAITTINYSSNSTITMTLANLGTSSTFLQGRSSVQIDNTSDKYIDALVSGSISVGTGPTANTTIAVYVYGADTSLASVAIDTIVGTDAGITLTNGVLNTLRLGATIAVPAANNDIAYPVLPFSVASLFGGVLPKYWGLFVCHNTAANLRNNTAANNNSFDYVGIKYDVA